jgi:hypothetical protein
LGGQQVGSTGYVEWAREQGRLPVSAVNFNERLLGLHGGEIEEGAVRGVRRWVGIGRRQEWA